MVGLLHSLDMACRALDRSGLDRSSKLENVGRLINILKINPLLVEKFSVERIFYCVRGLLGDSDTSVRASCFRAIRHTICDTYAVQHLLAYVDSFLMPASIVRAVIAVASYKDDNFRRVCLETLRELAIANTEIVARCGGLRTIVDCILDPACQDLEESLVLTILYILNEQPTRKFICPPVDLQILLAPFTDTDAPAGNERRQKWNSSRNAIITMMRSWTGILVLTSDPRGLKSLMQLLRHPVGEDVQHAIICMIYDIFQMPVSSSSNLNEGFVRTPSVVGRPPNSNYQSQNHAIPPHNLLDNYNIIILLSLIHCGLIDGLISLGMGSNKDLARPAINLLSQMLKMSSRLLPEEHCARLLAVPALVEVASTFTQCSQGLSNAYLDPEHMKRNNLDSVIGVRAQTMLASAMLAELASAVGSGISHRNANPMSQYVNGVHMASELLRGTNRPLHQTNAALAIIGSSRERIVRELKTSLDAQMDDTTFKDMLFQRSRVLLGKDWYKWDWDIISELLEGPLTNPNRLNEAMKTKFFKRLSGFFRCDPGNKGYFAQLPWIPDYVPYIRPACQMYTLLLNHAEGLHFLKTDRRGQLLSEIAAALELEARPEAAIVESHIGALQARMFSPEFCSRRMLREYFTLLGLMSSSQEGLRLLEQSNLFQRLYVMGKMQGHDFLCRLILANLDYTVDGSSRNLLQLWVTNGSKPLRLYATCLLRALLRSAVADFASWGIDVLVTQLYQEEEVAEAALSVLEEAAQTPEYLLAMIVKRPQKLVNLPSANNLLLRFLSLPEGLAFLKDMEWIPIALQQWRRYEYISYVHLVENALMKGLNRDASAVNQQSKGPVPIPVCVPQGRRHPTSHSDGEPQQAHWGLEWLFRLPWNMEVKIVGPPGSGPPSNLTLDTFVDASQIKNLEESYLSSDANSIKVKGIVVDARNIPQPVLVNSQQTLQACLFLGTQPVDRRGFTKPPPQSNGGFIQSYSNSLMNTKEKASSRNRTRSASSDTGRKPSGDVMDMSGIGIDLNGGTSDLDENKDWSSCRPEQRTASAVHKPECSICGPGERALWTFAVEESGEGESRTKKVWLKSIEFTLQLLPQKNPNVALPPHLYGELAKTNVGCMILKQSGHVLEFVELMRDPASVPLERRASLWALGHIAASSRGFELIRKCADDFLDVILALMRSADVLSIRGTCFYVLGLISRSGPGRKALSLHGWDSPKDTRATVAIPLDISELFQMPEYDYSTGILAEDIVSSIPVQALRNEWKDVIKLIGNLSNHITQKDAHASLNRLKSSQPELFENPKLALHAMQMLESMKYRLPVRQFIHGLFDKAVFSNTTWEMLKPVKRKGPSMISGPKRLLPGSIPTSTCSVQVIPRSTSRHSSIGTGRPAALSVGSRPPPSPLQPMVNAFSTLGLRKSSLSGRPVPIRKTKHNMDNTIFIGAPEAMV